MCWMFSDWLWIYIKIFQLFWRNGSMSLTERTQLTITIKEKRSLRLRTWYLVQQIISTIIPLSAWSDWINSQKYLRTSTSFSFWICDSVNLTSSSSRNWSGDVAFKLSRTKANFQRSGHLLMLSKIPQLDNPCWSCISWGIMSFIWLLIQIDLKGWFPFNRDSC